MSAVETHLFKPGDGARPPALTGREAEQAVLRRCLADLVAGAAPPHNVVLIGPRGNGKTALLNWFKSACDQADRRVDVVALAPPEVPTEARLVHALARRRLASWLPRKIGVASVGSAEWQRDDAGRQSLARVLEARCRRRPCAVLIDEAHTLDAKVGGALLNASQQVRAEAPFLLVLAGTPGLLAHLGTMDATFWGRLERRCYIAGHGLASSAAAHRQRRRRAYRVQAHAGASPRRASDLRLRQYGRRRARPRRGRCRRSRRAAGGCDGGPRAFGELFPERLQRAGAGHLRSLRSPARHGHLDRSAAPARVGTLALRRTGLGATGSNQRRTLADGTAGALQRFRLRAYGGAGDHRGNGGGRGRAGSSATTSPAKAWI